MRQNSSQMNNKTSIQKSNRPKKNRVSSSMIAEVVKCSPSHVRMIRTKRRDSDSDLAQTIEVVEIILEERMEKMIEEVKQLVKL